MDKVVLISCGARKLDHAAPARDLYTGSLFKAARRAAETIAKEWGIISARHGLVLPDQMVRPYEQRLDSYTLAELGAWAIITRDAIRSHWPGRSFIVLAPALYCSCVEGLPAEFPLRGLGIGLQLHVLRQMANAGSWPQQVAR